MVNKKTTAIICTHDIKPYNMHIDIGIKVRCFSLAAIAEIGVMVLGSTQAINLIKHMQVSLIGS